MSDENSKPGIEIVNLFRKVGADVKDFRVGMQGVRADISASGLDPAFRVAAIAGLVALKQLQDDADKTDSSSSQGALDAGG